ncbi:cytochrome P450 2J6-like isoform X2 [Pleurodeles waltl]|uniref:cytochrome P450 2J6-like isoform X2 n=1 Tax=Pleurodeles waltl TaxID=8319 RepID=UPI00370968B2
MLIITELLLVLFLTILIAHYLKLQWSRRQYPPGPTPLPILGNLWTLGFVLHHESLIQLAKTYGNIFTVWLGQKPVIVLNGCQTIRDALISHSEEFAGRPTIPTFHELSKGKGVILSSGHTWRQQRRFALTTLRNLGLGKKSLEARIQEEAKSLVEFFAMTKGKSLDPSPAIVHSVTNVISAVIFGHRFSRDDEEFHLLIKANDLFDAFPWLMRHLPGPHQDIFRSNAFLEEFLKKEIQSHKANGAPEEPQDLIDFYQDKISKDPHDVVSTFDEHNMVRLAADFFAAGTETTTSTLQWAFLYMVIHPEIQGNVQKELDAVLGQSQNIQYEDRKRLPYTNAVIHEIQRMSNVVAVSLFRETVKETSFQGFSFKKGSIFAPNLSSSLFDPDHWETPHQLNPGHFLDKEGKFMNKEAFLPFSAGHRVCLGEQLARIELFIFFTSLLRAFILRLPEGVKNVNMVPIFRGTLQPQPYRICAFPR